MQRGRRTGIVRGLRAREVWAPENWFTAHLADKAALKTRLLLLAMFWLRASLPVVQYSGPSNDACYHVLRAADRQEV